MKLLGPLLLAGVTSVLLTGCIYVVQPDRADDATSAPAPVGTTDCGDAPVTVTEESGIEYLTGACPLVSIQGNDLTVTMETVDSLVINGDRVTVYADDLGSIELGGNESSIEAGDVGSVRLNGDRNTIAGDAIGSVVIGGNDNAVTGASVGSSTVNGDRNTVGN